MPRPSNSAVGIAGLISVSSPQAERRAPPVARRRAVRAAMPGSRTSRSAYSRHAGVNTPSGCRSSVGSSACSSTARLSASGDTPFASSAAIPAPALTPT